MSRRKRKREAERRRQQEAKRRAKLAAIERELEAFAAELRAIQDGGKGQLSRDPCQLADDEREQWRRYNPRRRMTAFLRIGPWVFRTRLTVWSEDEAATFTRESRGWRWLPCVCIDWRTW